VTDMSKPGAHLQELLEDFERKKRQCWEDGRKAKMLGEVYEQCASDLRYALEKEEKTKQDSASEGQI